MRRKDKEITDINIIKKILLETKYVTLAICKENEPYLVSLSHGYDEKNNCIYFHSANEGKKIDWLKENPLVYGQAIKDFGYSEGECSHLYASVHFMGSVTILDNEESKRHAFNIMLNQLENNAETRERLSKSKGIPTTFVGKISIEHLSGKKSQEIEL